jgi:hypothetical protein
MATGDTNDFIVRIKALLPQRWFPTSSNLSQQAQTLFQTETGADITDANNNGLSFTSGPVILPVSATPILDGVLSGIGSMWAWLYSLIVYIALQTRIATATDVWLDIISLDYFGTGLPRNPNEPDATFSARIRANMFPPLQTRAAIVAAIQALTGRTPKIFEPANPLDGGSYNTGYSGYGVAGGYGSLALPFQLFVTAYRQITGGIPNVAGYSGNQSTPQYAPGGYGGGAIEYVTLAQAGTQTNDAAIYATVAKTQAAGVTSWVAVSN